VNAWLVIVAVGAGTYGLRASMFVVLGRRSLPAWTTTPMALVAPAAVAALVSSIVFTHGGSVQMPALVELAAIVGGFAAVRRTGNVMLAFAVGLPLFWIATALS
jgi:branched-subunit amino acid transport protein